jgi:hypothetical protein
MPGSGRYRSRFCNGASLATVDLNSDRTQSTKPSLLQNVGFLFDFGKGLIKMIKRAVKLIQVPALLLLSSFGVSQAQQVETLPKPEAMPKQEVSPEKRALVKQILDLTNSRQSSEAIFNAQFDEMEKQMPDIQWQAISSMEEFKKLTLAQQEDLRTRVKQSSTRQARRIKELFLQRIDMKQLVEDISYAVYDKHFTEAELSDLVAFYSSPTGKKVVAETPALFAESIAKAAELIAPRVKQIVEETSKDQTNELEQEVQQLLKTKPSTTAKKPASRRRH